MAGDTIKRTTNATSKEDDIYFAIDNVTHINKCEVTENQEITIYIFIYFLFQDTSKVFSQPAWCMWGVLVGFQLVYLPG